ncbi:MAG TPA: sigma-70 family RNA polymerase sigma factor [Gaiellaceae bacterium]|jgi:RNA polymerase sigma-70 factor (ECF subfamily)
MLLSDEDLLRRTGRGDSVAFDQLYRRFADSVFRRALRQLRDRTRAEDATQETFAAIWRSASTYKPERGPGAPWLFAVARNAVFNQMRARVPTPIEPPDSIADEPGPSEHAEAAMERARVHGALAILPPDQRAVIELAYWKELSQSEIAEKLGIPLGTVKTRTRRALMRLADELDSASP